MCKNTRLRSANNQFRPSIMFQNTAIQPKLDFYSKESTYIVELSQII